MSEVRTTECTFEFDGIEVLVEVEGDYEPYVPAKINGPAEYCYPAEGGCFSITAIHVVDEKGKRTGQTLDLPGWLITKLEDRLYDQVAEQDFDAYAD
jgi:hypothetical protein